MPYREPMVGESRSDLSVVFRFQSFAPMMNRRGGALYSANEVLLQNNDHL